MAYLLRIRMRSTHIRPSGRDAYAGSTVLLFSFIGLFQLFSDFHQGKTENVITGPI